MKNGIYSLNIFFFILITLSITTQVYSINFNGNRGNQKPIRIIESPNNITFSLTTAFEHLMYSYATYCPVEQLSNWTCPYCTLNGYLQPLYITQYLINSTTNTFGYLGVTSDNLTIVIAFRGTQFTSLDNWITNLNFPKMKPYPQFVGALVHEGFYEAYMGINEQLINGFMRTLKECITCNKLIITGHSLGGAIAQFASLAVYENSLTDLPLEIYTFGSPRIGDIGFVDYYESIFKPFDNQWGDNGNTNNPNISVGILNVNVINDRDIVPHLPSIYMNFHRLPTEVWFNTSIDPLHYIICDNTGEDPTCSDSLDVALSIEDHLNYLGVNKDLC